MINWLRLNKHRKEDSHHRPSVDAILDIAFILDSLGKVKPYDQRSAKTQLVHLAKKVIETDATNDDVVINSITKKAERLDKHLNNKRECAGLLKAWLDPNIDSDAWRHLRERHSRFLDSVAKIADGMQHLTLAGSLDDCEVVLKVETTRMLSTRILPSVLKRFYEQTEKEGARVHVELLTRQPYMLIDECERLVNDADLVLTYGRPMSHSVRQWDDHRVFNVPLHRCLLRPMCDGSTAGTNSDLSLVKGNRVAILSDAELVMEGFEWAELMKMASDVDVRRSGPEIHSYVRSGCGLAISHVEFLDELEQKELQSIELSKKFGVTEMTCVVSSQSTEANRKDYWLEQLAGLVETEFERIRLDYSRSAELTHQFQRLRYSYSTTGVHKAGKKVSFHGRRGTLDVEVTPSMYIHGELVLSKAPGFPDASRQEEDRFRLLGRVQQDEKTGKAMQMVLRAMNQKGREISMGTFVLEADKEKLQCPGLGEPCLIGHWLGRDSNHANAGAWIWHEDANLELHQVRTLLEKYAKLHATNVCPFQSSGPNRLVNLWGVSPVIE